MDQIKACAICGNVCFDESFGPDTESFCQPCSLEVHFEGPSNAPFNLRNRKDPRHGDTFPIDSSFWVTAIAKVKARTSKQQKLTQAQDKPCRNCSRSCTPGDKTCWWCEAANPC